jgi:hypothetical protein
MKELYSFQEIGTLIDQGQQAAFTCHPVARVTVTRRESEQETIHVTIDLLIGEYHIATFEEEYPSIETILEMFEINDLAEIWEVTE